MKGLKHKFGSRLIEQLWEQRLQSSGKVLQSSKKLITQSKKLESACDELLKNYPHRKELSSE